VDKYVWRELTVANIREGQGAGPVRVVFLESARFFELPRSNRNFDKVLARLRDALAHRKRSKVKLSSRQRRHPGCGNSLTGRIQ